MVYAIFSHMGCFMENALALANPTGDFNLDDGLVENLHKRRLLEAEEALMLAVLEDAISCYQKYAQARDPKGKARFREVEDWINGEESDWIFSFKAICEVLGIDPGYLREGLAHWKEKTAQKKRVA